MSIHCKPACRLRQIITGTKHARSRSHVMENDRPHLTYSQAASLASVPPTCLLQDVSAFIQNVAGW